MFQNDIDFNLPSNSNWSNTIGESSPVCIEHVDDMLLLLLSITSYVLYLYVEDVDEIIEGMFMLKGLLIDPFSFSQNKHKDEYVKEAILEHLENLL